MIQSAVTKIFTLIEVLSYGAQYGYSQTNDFQQALKKVVICPVSYQEHKSKVIYQK